VIVDRLDVNPLFPGLPVHHFNSTIVDLPQGYSGTIDFFLEPSSIIHTLYKTHKLQPLRIEQGFGLKSAPYVCSFHSIDQPINQCIHNE